MRMVSFLRWAFVLGVLAVVDLRAGVPVLPDPLVVQGSEYRGPLYVSQDRVWLSFAHEDGSGRVRMADLAPELQRSLGFDPALAAQQLAEERGRAASARAAVEAVQRNKQVIQGVVARNTAQGLLLTSSLPTGETKEVTRKVGDRYETSNEPIYEDVLFCIAGHPNAVYFKRDANLTLEILPEGTDFVEGAPVIKARFLRDLR